MIVFLGSGKVYKIEAVWESLLRVFQEYFKWPLGQIGYKAAAAVQKRIAGSPQVSDQA